MKEIKYLAYYAPIDDCEQRSSHILAAYNFINYVCEQIISLGYSITMISASRTQSKNKYYGSRVEKVNDRMKIHYLPTFPKGSKVYKLLDIITLRLSVFFELLKCKKDDDVLVYHATSYMTEVKLAHRLKHFRWILYVGEIYGDVDLSERLKKKEMSYFKKADGYIFATEFLDKIINQGKKPNVVLYGAYRNEPSRNIVKEDTKVHCVYAGTFDARKGEAQQSVLAAQYLPSNYVVHICGFGTDDDTTNILNMIKDVNRKEEKVIYEGRLHGEEFIRLLQKCDIGLFTPIADAKFNESDFPSKIFSYLTNGLRVVSARVVPVEKSMIGRYMVYYDGNNPKDIAGAIQSIDFSKDYDSRTIVTDVEERFRKEFNDILK